MSDHLLLRLPLALLQELHVGWHADTCVPGGGFVSRTCSRHIHVKSGRATSFASMVYGRTTTQGNILVLVPHIELHSAENSFARRLDLDALVSTRE